MNGASRFIGDIYGNLTGNADTATTLATGRTFSISDNDATNTGPASSSFDGSSNLTIKLPATIKATLTGNAANVTGIVATDHGGTGNTSYAANRLIYSESATKLSVSNHYASSTKIAVNSTSEPDYNLYVNGTTYI